MTDNRTTELLPRRVLHDKLDEHGIDYWCAQQTTFWNGENGSEFLAYQYQVNGVYKFAFKGVNATPEQAIAATLGSERHPYEQRITGDGSDWGEIMRDAYDDLMASACESCTPEQMDQLADYIRAELGSGTCKMVVSGTPCNGNTDVACTKCGAYNIGTFYDGNGHRSTPRFCPSCGAKAVGR